MNDIECYCSKPSLIHSGCLKDFAYNGCEYIFLDPLNCKILKYDDCFNYVDSICIKHKFTSICFDYIEKCYWAITDYDAQVLFQLDECFDEINRVYMKDVTDCYANGISYNDCTKTIWVSFRGRVGYVEKGCYQYTYIDNPCKKMVNKAVLSLPCCKIIGFEEEGKSYISIARPKCYERETICIPEEYDLEDLCLCPVSHKQSAHCDVYQIGVLLIHRCNQGSFFKRCYIKCGFEDDYYCNYDNRQSPCCRPNDYPPPCPCEPNCQPGCAPCCGCCAQEPCCQGCTGGGCCCDCGCESCCHGGCCDELWHIVHSIALEESGISHILNAEGEKIQKAVAQSATIEELLAVNESVNQTIVHITQLEMQLFFKLEAVCGVCDCEMPCPNNCFPCGCEPPCPCECEPPCPCECEPPCPCDCEPPCPCDCEPPYPCDCEPPCPCDCEPPCPCDCEPPCPCDCEPPCPCDCEPPYPCDCEPPCLFDE